MENRLGEWLADQMKLRDISLRNAAMKCDLAPRTMFRILHGRVRPSPETVKKLARGFSVSVDRLYDLAGMKSAGSAYSLPPEWEAEFGRIQALPADLQAIAWTTLRIQLDALENIAKTRPGQWQDNPAGPREQ